MIDPIRHIEVFSPEEFGDQLVDIIGVGAVGSRIALSLAKLGIANIRVWDFDKIEEHNIANQIYGNDQIGQFKAEALRDLIKRNTGNEIQAMVEKVDGTQELGDIIFLSPDTMASRQEIWDKAIKLGKGHAKAMFDSRMGADSARTYWVNPIMRSHILGWEKTLYKDEQAVESLCGTPITVGPTAEITAALAVWSFIRWFRWDAGKDDFEPENEIISSVNPPVFVCKQFK